MRKVQYAAVFLLALMLCGCHEEKKIRIGVAQCSSDAWRTSMNEEIMREQLFHDDIEVEIRSAEDQTARQIEDLRYFARNGFDIILVAPNEAKALTPIIDSIYGAKIPVIVFDRKIESENYTAFHGADNYAIGKAAAKYAQSVAGKEVNALEIIGLASSTPAISRHEGFSHSAAAHKGFNIVASAPADWNSEKSAVITDSLLRTHPETNVIFAHNDLMAIAASRVAKSMGRNDIKVIGIDGAPNVGMQAVADSILDATFIYSSAGDQLIRTAIAIVKNEPFDRTYNIPYHSAVDLSNVEILLAQNKALSQETAKINMLKNRIELYLQRHAVQMTLLYAAIVGLIFVGIILLMWQRMFLQKKRHRADVFMSRNEALKELSQNTQNSQNPQNSQNSQDPQNPQNSPSFSPSDQEFYENLLKAMRARISETNVTVDDLAAELSISRVQFYRKAKALTGYTPSDLMRNLRLQHADLLLKTTNNTIASISASVGFTSPSYFTKCYREYFGETPTAVQEKYNQ